MFTELDSVHRLIQYIRKRAECLRSIGEALATAPIAPQQTLKLLAQSQCQPGIVYIFQSKHTLQLDEGGNAVGEHG